MPVNDAFRATYQYGTLLILPPPHVAAIVDELRERYDPASAAVCGAHITLTQPFAAEPGEAELMLVGDTLAGFEPFFIHWGPLATFLPYPCIYFAIQPREPVMQLRGALHGLGFFNLALPFSGDDFVPHMSITDGHPDAEETERIFEELHDTVPNGVFPCSEVVYSRPDELFRFQTIRIFSLGRGA
jgi:2'-5' RNA ligase